MNLTPSNPRRRGRDTHSATRAHTVSRGIAALAVTVAAGLAGCASPADLTMPTRPTQVPASVAETGSCTPGTLLYSSCVSRAEAKAAAANARAEREYQAAMEAYEARVAEVQAARESGGGLSRWGAAAVALGVLVLVGCGVLAWKAPSEAAESLDPRRDPAGPHAMGIAAGGQYARRLNTVFALAGIPLIAWGLGGVGGALLAGIPAALAGWGITRSARRWSDAEDGYALAETHYQTALREALAVEQARLQDAANQHSDLGIHAAVPVAQVDLDEPHMGTEEAVAYGRTGGVQLVAGSAAARLLDATGRALPAGTFWKQACEAARLGAMSEGDRPRFVPSVKLLKVSAQPNGDAILTAKPDSISVGETQLKAVIQPFLHAAGIRAAGGDWSRDHTTGEWSLTVTNRGPAKAAPAEDEWV